MILAENWKEIQQTDSRGVECDNVMKEIKGVNI